jgi:hypothetical protein
MIKDLRCQNELISKASLINEEREKMLIEKQFSQEPATDVPATVVGQKVLENVTSVIINAADNEKSAILKNNSNSNSLNKLKIAGVTPNSQKPLIKKCLSLCNTSRALTLCLILIILGGLLWYFFSNDQPDSEEENRRLFSLKLKELSMNASTAQNNSASLYYYKGPKSMSSTVGAKNSSTNASIGSTGNIYNGEYDFYNSNLFVCLATISIVLIIILFVFVSSLMPYLRMLIKADSFTGRSIALSVFYDDRYNQVLYKSFFHAKTLFRMIRND